MNRTITAPRKVEQIEDLLRTGMPVSAVIQEVGCAASLAYRVRKKLEEAGAISRQRGKPGPKRDSTYAGE